MLGIEFLSPLYLIVLALYFLTSSIKMFDIRMTQAKNGAWGEDARQEAQSLTLPGWVGAVFYLDFLLGGLLLLFNWKATLVVWIVRFVLKVLPVLETVGNLLMFPFRPKPLDREREARDLERVLRDLAERETRGDTFAEVHRRMADMLAQEADRERDAKRGGTARNFNREKEN